MMIAEVELGWHFANMETSENQNDDPGAAWNCPAWAGTESLNQALAALGLEHQFRVLRLALRKTWGIAPEDREIALSMFETTPAPRARAI